MIFEHALERFPGVRNGFPAAALEEKMHLKSASAFIVEKCNVPILEDDWNIAGTGEPIGATKPAVKRGCVDCFDND